MDYHELKAKARVVQDKQTKRAIKNYHYARSKGFTARESTFLQYKSQEEIDTLAKQRDEEDGG